MKIKKIIAIVFFVFALLAILASLNPNITGFSVKDLAVVDVTISAEKQVDTELIFEQSKDNAEKIDKPIYYYLKIRNADFADMNYFLVKFKVEKQWLKTNGLTKEDISLYFLKNSWNKAETRFLEEDEEYYYYEAKTEVTSTFAIVVERVKVLPEIKEEKNRDILYFAILPLIFIGLIGLVGVLFVIWLYKRIRYYHITQVIKKIFYYICLFLISNLLILSLFSRFKIEEAIISSYEVLIYGLIPVLILALVLTLVLHGLIKLYQKVTLVKKFSRFLLDYGIIFAGLTIISYALPAKELVVTNTDILLFGILPLIILSFIILGLFKFVERLVHKVWW